MISEDGRTLLTLSLIRGIGHARLRQLARHPQLSHTYLKDVATLLPALASSLAAANLIDARHNAERQVDLAEQDGARIITILDPAYPPLLQAVPDAPAILFIKGTLQPTRCLAVIGTREPTEHGAEIARRATRYFAERGWSVISGLALGIDALAHRTALEVQGHTVAVLAHGLQTVVPRSHQALANEIVAAGGALVTEYPYGTAPFPAHFVKRDRIQAGLAQGVLMVQSGHDGGSLHASRASLAYGRPLAVPVPTPRDQAAQEAKIQGNLMMLGSAPEAAELLRCTLPALRLLVPLPSKEAYPELEQALQQPFKEAAEPDRLL
jgi:DNA processing protein